MHPGKQRHHDESERVTARIATDPALVKLQEIVELSPNAHEEYM